jgi:hypothetical protein
MPGPFIGERTQFRAGELTTTLASSLLKTVGTGDSIER